MSTPAHEKKDSTKVEMTKFSEIMMTKIFSGSIANLDYRIYCL
jgi:hypothetical protein